MGGRSEEEAQAGAPDFTTLAAQLAAEGLSVRDLRARLMAAGMRKNEAYALALQVDGPSASPTPLPDAATMSGEDPS